MVKRASCLPLVLISGFKKCISAPPRQVTASVVDVEDEVVECDSVVTVVVVCVVVVDVMVVPVSVVLVAVVLVVVTHCW